MHSKSTLLKTHDKKREMGVICNLIHKWKKRDKWGERTTLKNGPIMKDSKRQSDAEMEILEGKDGSDS